MRGRILKSIVILTILITMLMANIVMLCYQIVEAVYDELETQNVTTNVRNIDFDAYFLNEGIKSHVGQSNLTDVKNLILNVNVKEAGSLNDAKIKIENTNFEILKDQVNNEYVKNINLDTNEIELNQIIYQNNVEIEIPIRFKKQDNFEEDYFEKENTISLTGTYIEGESSGRNVTGQIKTRVVYQEQTDISLATDIEKYMNLGTNGILLQESIITEVANNRLPRKTETIEATVPMLEGVLPQTVIVTKNGEKLAEDKVTYDTNTQKVTISDDTSGTWSNYRNEYKVIYNYKDIEFKPQEIEIGANMTSTLYTQEAIQKSDTKVVALEEKGSSVSISKTVTGSMYKGYMYANSANGTNYLESNKIEVSEINTVESIEVEKANEIFEDANGNQFGVGESLLYTSTTLYKNELEKIFGQDYVITITDVAGNVLHTVTKDTPDENGTITLSYDGGISSIKVNTSKPVNEGVFSVNNVRSMQGNTGYSKDNLKQFVTLKTQTAVTTNKVQNPSTEVAESATALQDTKTEAKIEISNSNLSTTQINENVQLLVTLKSNSEQYDLYRNPVIEIILPQGVGITVTNISQLNGLEEIHITNATHYTNEAGQEVVRLQLQGEQVTFGNEVNEGIQIAITANIETEKTTPTQATQIVMNYTNENRAGEVFTATTPVQLNSKYGVLTVNQLSGYNAQQEVIENMDDKIKTAQLDTQSEAREAKQEFAVVNNYDTEITDIAIIGTVPTVGEQTLGTEEIESTFEVELKEALNLEGKAANIFYSEDENATKESDSWKQEVTDFNNVRAFKIELQDNKLASSEVLELSYDLQIPEMLETNESSYTNVALYYNYLGSENVINSTILMQTEQTQINEGVVLTNDESEPMTIALIGKTGGEALSDGQEIYEGQAIKYLVKMTNNTQEAINNIAIKATQSNAIFYTEKVYNDGWDSVTDTEGVSYSRYEEDESLTEKEINIETLNPGETITKEYEFSVKEVEGEEETTSGKIEITADGQETKTYNTFTNPIVQAELKLQIRDNYELENPLRTGSDYPFFFDVTNLSGKKQENIILSFEVPEGFTFDSTYLWEPENDEYRFISYENNILTVEILTLEVDQMLNIRLSLDIEQMETNVESKTYDFVYTATLGENTYISNERTQIIYNWASKITAIQAGSIEGEEVENGNNLTYTVEVANEGPRDLNIHINDSVPAGAVVNKATIEIYEGENLLSTEEQTEFVENNVYYETELSVGQRIVINIETTINTDLIFTEEITNMPEIITSNQEITCNEITYKVKGVTVNDPENPSTPEDPNNPSNPGDTDPDATYQISGTAWLDSNKNGVRELSEELMSNVEVILIQESTGAIATNEQGGTFIEKTDENGIYTFENVEQGNYLVAFRYDTATYRVTQYQTQGANANMNSDVISRTITLNGNNETVAITGSLRVENANVTDIDAGFIKNEKFDLRLDKSISRIIVQNSAGTTVRQYNNTQLAKIEIDSKQLANSTVIIEYTIQITNEGELPGYVNEIVDYKPNDLSFSSEMNKSWYETTDGQLRSKELVNQSINPGETKAITLTLIKTMSQENTGTIINTAEISQASNDLSIADIDSTPGNKTDGEDDISTAQVIISIRTGGAVMYISLILIIIAIIGIGSFVIKKKVLDNNNEDIDLKL